MKFADTVTIAAPRDRVAAALADPAVLQACIPGCTAVRPRPNDRFEIEMTIPTGLRKMTLSGTVRMDRSAAPERIAILRGGNGRADIALEEAGGVTRLTYEASAEIRGKAAMLGAGMIGGIARRLASSFFERLEKRLAAG